MKIREKDWLKYRNKLRELSEEASEEMLKWAKAHGGFANIERAVIVRYAYALATKYGEASASLAADMYDAVAILSKAHVPEAVVAPTATMAEVGKAINGSMKFSTDDAYISNVVGRLVKQAGQDTTVQNAVRDHAEWAWIPDGGTCAFCLTLASQGWQRASKSALDGYHAEHIHANCDCAYAIRFNSNTNVQGYDPIRYLRMYQDADGSNSKEKINAMRRMAYAEDKKTEGTDNDGLIEV